MRYFCNICIIWYTLHGIYLIVHTNDRIIHSTHGCTYAFRCQDHLCMWFKAFRRFLLNAWKTCFKTTNLVARPCNEHYLDVPSLPIYVHACMHARTQHTHNPLQYIKIIYSYILSQLASINFRYMVSLNQNFVSICVEIGWETVFIHNSCLRTHTL